MRRPLLAGSKATNHRTGAGAPAGPGPAEDACPQHDMGLGHAVFPLAWPRPHRVRRSRAAKRSNSVSEVAATDRNCEDAGAASADTAIAGGERRWVGTQNASGTRDSWRWQL